jgi:hypothetical protein
MITTINTSEYGDQTLQPRKPKNDILMQLTAPGAKLPSVKA